VAAAVAVSVAPAASAKIVLRMALFRAVAGKSAILHGDRHHAPQQETFMDSFSVGEKVIVRWGTQQGKKAKILKCQPANVYTVKLDDGSVLIFSGKGLEKEKQAVR
jgi:hypothetical protein